MNIVLWKPNSWRAGRMLMFLWSAQLPAPALPKSVHVTDLLNILHFFVCLFNQKCLRRARKELYLISSFPCMPDTLMNDLMSSYGNSEKWLILSSVYKGGWSSETWSNLPEIRHTRKWRIINLNTLARKTVVISTMPCYLLTWTSFSKCWLFCSLFFSFLHTDLMQRYHIPILHCFST